RMTTHAPLLGQDPAYLRSRIDSLLYENIPGKIVRQRDITHQGYPGYDILNKTRRGDYQRYRILITPLEVWVFKVGGTGDFAKGKDGDKFLESLELEPYVSRGWQTFQPASGGFEVELPGTVRYEKVAGNPGRYFQDDILQAFDPSNGHYYLLVRASMHDFEYIEEDTFELNRLAESVAEDLGYESHDRSLGTWKGYPYLQARLSRETRPDLFLRILIRGGHYYLMMARTPEVPERFFTSFRVAPNHYADTASLKQDSLLQFSVHSVAESRNNADRARRFTRFLELDNDKPTDHTNLSRSTEYSYPKTGERIGIQYWRMHKFHQVKDTAELWEKHLENLTNDGDLVVRSRHSDTLQGMPTLDVELTDTNSIRCIRSRSILKERVLYTLWTMGDTLSASTPLVEAFFDSFRPSDSTVLPSVFEDKADQLMADILSADSATQAQARDALGRVTLEDRHASEVMQLIEDFEYRDGLEPLNKAHLIQKLGDVHAKAVVPYLEDLYDRVGDTATFQF
ncbi:MAG: hypothetical protein AAGB22_10985, partial [Bacteroidota bacterium]